MFSLKESSYPAHMLISFWCDSVNKNFDFLRFRIFSDILFIFILASIKICKFIYTTLLELFLNICSMHIGPEEFAR